MTASGTVRTDLLDQDARVDRRVLLTVTGVSATAYAVGAIVQTVYVLSGSDPDRPMVGFWVRAGANAVAVATLLGMLLAWQQHRRTRRDELTFGVLLAGVVVGVVRVAAQVALGVYPGLEATTTSVELVSGTAIGLVAGGAGTWAMLSRRGQRREARAAQQLAVQRALAIAALEDEESRVRRDVAEGLHASVQQRLVLLVAQVAEVAVRLRAGEATPRDAAVLDEVRAGLDRVREDDVRGLSHLLYPDHLDVGLAPAVRALLRRVPASVATRLDLDAAVRAADDPQTPALSRTERLLAVRVVEEGIANALRHGRPGEIAVAIHLSDGLLTVSVADDGPGFDAAAVGSSGLARLEHRLEVGGGTLDVVGQVAGGGAALTARLPVLGLVSA